MTEEEKWNTALFIAIDDLNYPNHETRQKAIKEGCFVEFMEIRQQLIEQAQNKMYKAKGLHSTDS